MDDTEDDARYPPKAYSLNRSRNFPLYPHHHHLPPVTTHYNHDYDDDEDEEEEEEYELFIKNDDEFGFDQSRFTNPRGYFLNYDQDDALEAYPKRQKLKNSVSNYELAARSLSSPPPPPLEWSEHEKFVLLEVWGDRFLQSGRSSLRSEEWADVAEKVSETVKVKRSDAQCRQMMDALKRKYKKEKAKGVNGSSKWALFKKLDMLMMRDFGGGCGGSGSGSGGGFSLGCGLDSGEYVFMDTRVYLDHANGNDEMRDSPCESEEDEEEEEGEKEREGKGGNEGVKGLRLLADSVQKFGEIYEKIEYSKKEQMMELERMRDEFQRELELQKKQILEQAQIEIAKIRDGDEEEEEEDTDDDIDSGEDLSE